MRRPWWVFVVPVALGVGSAYYQFLPLIKKRQREDAEKKLKALKQQLEETQAIEEKKEEQSNDQQ